MSTITAGTAALIEAELNARDLLAEERPKYRARMADLKFNSRKLLALTEDQAAALRTELAKLPRIRRATPRRATTPRTRFDGEFAGRFASARYDRY